MAAQNLDFIIVSPFLASIFIACFAQSSLSYQFLVGGKDGWVVNPSESYDQWAGRSRFSINDTLLFKYVQGSDSVLVVNKDDFDNCSAGNPILKMEDGNSVFKFDRSGPFYFISGVKDNCDKGQKLITVVLALTHSPPHAASPPNITPSIAPLSPQPADPPSSPSATPSASPDQSPSPAAAGDVSPRVSPTPDSNPSAGNRTAADGGRTPSGSAAAPSFGAPACSPPLVFATIASFLLTWKLGGLVF